ncbi:MAG: GGDEF domain-containing protein [Shinella sp.]|nr:GGDEF domain-containing protein [Shinella sp.]
MFEELVSIPTLMICTFLAALVVGIFMLQLWLRDRGQVMAGYWCLSLGVGTVCTVLLALRGVIDPLLTTGLGNLLACFAYSLAWAGFRKFDGRRIRASVIFAGPLLWAGAYLFWPFVADDVNNRIILMSVIIFGYSLAMAVDIRRGYRLEPLPARSIGAVLFATHAIFYALRIPLAIVDPADLRHGVAHSTWFAAFTLELFVHTIVVVVTMLILIKERGEFVYRKASRTDALTGVANRGSFLDDVEALLRRNKSSGVLMIFDLDHFKSVNDTFGHLAGDHVLKSFTALVSSRLEKGMLFGRFGGEEFALFAPDTDFSAACGFAEMLRTEIAAAPVSYHGETIEISVSIGLASAAPYDGDFDRLLAAADSALYCAKEEGRDRIVTAAQADVLARMADRMRKSQPRAEPDAGFAAI